MKQFFFNRWRIYWVLIFLLVAGMRSGWPITDNEVRKIVHRFFTLVYRQHYQQAYNQFSRSVKNDVDYEDFVEGAQQVRYLKILSIQLQDKEANLIKTKIRALLHVIYKGALYEAVYEGEVSLYKEKAGWKVMTVDLDVKSQKLLDKHVKPTKLQKLDFGTK